MKYFIEVVVTKESTGKHIRWTATTRYASPQVALALAKEHGAPNNASVTTNTTMGSLDIFWTTKAA
tara:strand:+ start:598 stop:795 length:198 start_codon:yes stop_codon:yes gene_type:complete